MKKPVVLMLLSAIALIGVSFLSPTLPALAAVIRQDSGNVRLESDPTEQLAAEYWTPEMMAAAEANTPPRFYQEAAGGAQGTAFTLLADGPARGVNGHGIGGVSGNAEAKNLGGGTGIPSFTYPFPYTLGYLQISGLNASAPYSTIGKLYYTQNGTPYVCSGNSVATGTAGNYNLVLTAAHCLHDGNGTEAGKSTNIAYVPAKLGASEPFGQYSASAIWVKTSWYSTGNEREDFGFIVTNPNGCGDLADCAGAQGLAWNQKEFQDFWAIGYPAVSPFPGDRQVLCTASTAKLDTAIPGTGAPPLGMGCGMTGGSSGGGWAISFKTANMGYLNSVVAYKYTTPNQPNAIYGPYFASSFESLWNSARLDAP
jgi:hypothetical protein